MKVTSGFSRDNSVSVQDFLGQDRISYFRLRLERFNQVRLGYTSFTKDFEPSKNPRVTFLQVILIILFSFIISCDFKKFLMFSFLLLSIILRVLTAQTSLQHYFQISPSRSNLVPSHRGRSRIRARIELKPCTFPLHRASRQVIVPLGFP